MAKPLPWAQDHPFLSFRFNTDELPKETWALLGECSSKIEHVMGTPLRRDLADKLNTIFLVKGAHATTAIEGNTLSEDQVRQRVKGELVLPPTQEYLGLEVDNILKAYKYLVQQLNDGVSSHLSPKDLSDLNRMVLEGLDVAEGVVPGQYRSGRVQVGDYLSPSAEFTEELVNRGCAWLNHEVWGQRFAGPFIIPILRAIISHLYIAWIHPFGDGNGRTARLVEFDLLIRAGVPVSCAHLLSDHYNKTRSRYYQALSRARTDPKHFVCYAVEGLRDLLREQIDMIRSQQLEVTWQNYIFSAFRADDDSKTAKRRRDVALALGRKTKLVKVEDIPSMSPKVAERYAGLVPRTVTRDLKALQERGLIIWRPDGVKANLGLVKAFLPLKGAATPLSGVPEIPSKGRGVKE